MANAPQPRAPKPDDAQVSIHSTGFAFGALTVDRLCTLPKGGAAIQIETPKIALTVTATKTGKLRVIGPSGIELMVSK